MSSAPLDCPPAVYLLDRIAGLAVQPETTNDGWDVTARRLADEFALLTGLRLDDIREAMQRRAWGLPLDGPTPADAPAVGYAANYGRDLRHVVERLRSLDADGTTARVIWPLLCREEPALAKWWRGHRAAPSTPQAGEESGQESCTTKKPVAEGSATDAPSNSAAPPADPCAPKKSKKSTERGEARRKIIAALNKHHQYADGSCLNYVPISNNALARRAEVATSTASTFFEKAFQGHGKYRALCTKKGDLGTALKILNGEFAPHVLYGRTPPGEGPTDDE